MGAHGGNFLPPYLHDSAFRRVANQTLSTVYVSGAIIKIFQKWFSEMGVKPSPMLQAMYVLQARPN